MHYVYFAFTGYRVAIGRSSDLLNRITNYKRTHYDVFVLGVIECDSKEQSKLVERETLKRFSDCNAFRDMFYLTPEMIDWIRENTIGLPEGEQERHRERERERHRERRGTPEYQEYQRKWRENNPEYRKRNRERRETPEYQERDRERRKDPEYRERNREYQRERRKDPEYQERDREYQRERYHNDPEYRKRHREYQAKWQKNNPDKVKRNSAKRRKKRPVSPHTLDIF